MGVDQQRGRRRRPHTGKGELAQADLPGPPGQHHEGHGDDPVDGDVGRQGELGLREDERYDEGHQGDGRPADEAGGAHLGQSGQHGGDGPDLLDGHVAAETRVVGAGGPPALGQQGDEHHGEQGDVDRGRPGVAPEHGLLEDPDPEAGAHGHREALHAGDHRRGQRGQQRLGTGDDAQVGTEDRRRQHGAEARQSRRHHPRDARQASHGDAEQQGPLDACRASRG